MKINVLIIFFLAVSKTFIYGQEVKQNKFSIYIGSGLIQYTTSDQLLNYYNYSGNARMPFCLSGSYIRSKNLFTLNLLYQTSKLNPINLMDGYYDYNYIDQRNAEFSFEYFREIAELNKYVQVSLGIDNSSYITQQQENYKSLLYDNAEGFRKSYDVSAISLSPMLLVNFRFKKNNLLIKAGLSLLHYTARPDDNYVKQIGLPENLRWSLLGPKGYKSILFSAFYQYEIFHGFGVTAGYHMLYRSYSTTVEYKYLSNSYLLGVFKSF